MATSFRTVTIKNSVSNFRKTRKAHWISLIIFTHYILNKIYIFRLTRCSQRFMGTASTQHYDRLDPGGIIKMTRQVGHLWRVGSPEHVLWDYCCVMLCSLHDNLSHFKWCNQRFGLICHWKCNDLYESE